ncbi:MAG: hypothetical protein GYA48_11665 [Chloroflexi bacterium]|nr:hypothetical protein [Chloroflexota bacterium]
MKQNTRIFIGVAIVVLVAAVVLVVDNVQRQAEAERLNAQAIQFQITALPPGSIPIYIGERIVAGFTPDDLASLTEASFVDAEEGKTQQGWLLRDILSLYLPAEQLQPDTQVTVISTSREKQVNITWKEIKDETNMVMFDVSGRGTLKLVSKLDYLDVRDEWIQDVDRIEVTPQ